MAIDKPLMNGRDITPSPINSAFTTGVQLLKAGRASLLLRHSTEPVLIIAAAIGLDSTLMSTIRVLGR